MRHPCDRGRMGKLGKLVFLAVRDALYSPAHPDSKRQERRRQRDLARYGARIMKASGEVYCAGKSTNARKVLRRELREARERRREETRREQLRMARAVAERLLGRRRAA